MKDLKKEIGKKIKVARLNRGMTQADICDDESELTIRQLVRIENGQAMPTIPKLMILSKKLGISIQNIVDVENIEISKEYMRLKTELINFPTYADEDRIKHKEDILEIISKNYYDDLPEEEQLFVDVFQARLDIYGSLDVSYGLVLLEEYFQQILKKSSFNINDLLIIELYFFCCVIGLEDTTYFEKLAEKVLLYTDYEDKDCMVYLEKILLIVTAKLVDNNDENSTKYINCFKELVNQTRHVFYKPFIYMFEAKYTLNIEKDREKAENLYEKAITFATLLDDDLLVQRILEEKKSIF